MSRKPVFDAIKTARGGTPWIVAEVHLVDDLLDTLGVPREVPVGARSLSKAITDYVKGVEKLAKLLPDGRVEAYMPTPNDVPTIGYGSTGPGINMGTIWTKAQAEARFAADFAKFAAQVSNLLGDAPTTQGQFDAMVSLAYNIGIGAFKDSTLRKLHLAGNYAGAKAQFARWNKQAGQALNGLTKRRSHEAGVYGS